MSRLSRFRHIEKQRRTPAESATGVVKQRFDDASPALPQAETAPRSGPKTQRFAAEPLVSADERPLRLREDDEGLPFIRCGRCRFDNPVRARACDHCGADITTPMQRAFNEALHERLTAEREAERVEVARLDAARLEAQREYKEILRRGVIPHHPPPNPARLRIDALGRRIGIWLAQQLPNRHVRHGALAAFAILWFWGAWRAPLAVTLLTLGAIGLGLLLVERWQPGQE